MRWFPRASETCGRVAIAAMFAVIPGAGYAQQGEAITAVRPMGTSLGVLVSEGRARSPTFASLIQTIERSGWIVFLQPGSCRVPKVLACLLQRVGRGEGQPYLRVVFRDASTRNDEAIARIGHELQHAVEVISDPHASETGDIGELYHRIGYVSLRTALWKLYDTRLAIRTGTEIARELRTSRSHTRRAHGTSP